METYVGNESIPESTPQFEVMMTTMLDSEKESAVISFSYSISGIRKCDSMYLHCS